MSGTGIDFTLAPSGADTVTVSTGSSAVFPLLLRPAVNTNDAVTYTCAGAPTYTKCTVTSQHSDLSATGTVTVTLLTGTTAKSIRAGLLLLPMILLPMCALRSSRRYGALLLLLCCITLGVQGCGSGKYTVLTGTGTGTGGSGSGGGTTPITPNGTYAITVSATAAGVTHTVPLTLKVQ